MNNRDLATGAGGAAGFAFGPELVDYLGQVFVYASGLSTFPEMPEKLVIGLGTLVGALLTRWLWGEPWQREQFPRREEEL